ncbi:MAG: hypothetical protein ACM3W8_04465 [Sideroxydans sp.]
MLLLAAFLVAATGFCVGSAQALPKAPPVRAVHVVLNSLAVSDLVRLADMAERAGFNTMILDLGNKVAFRNFPGQLSPNAWSPDELLSGISYIRGKGMEVIPGVPLLSHQWQFLAGTHPELMFNSSDYDPGKAAVYKLVFPYLDEVISAIKPRAIHIGHDEVESLPADAYLHDVNVLRDYLKQRNIETWMWGDMLLSRDEFPSMFPGPLSGNAPGYGKALRDKLPKDIVICDWHYRDTQTDFPSLAAFKAGGFRVLGATWKNSQTTRNFSRYAALHGAGGMIVTTWFDPNDPKVVHSWGELSQIIQEAGKDFAYDFK